MRCLLTVLLMLGLAGTAMASATGTISGTAKDPGTPYVNPPAPAGGRILGDFIGDPLILPPPPCTVTGTTIGFQHDYDEVCPYSGSMAPDVVYAYAVPVGGPVSLTLDLCHSSYDTKLFVYDNIYTPGYPYACNDDYNVAPCYTYTSKIIQMPVTVGHIYYIVIDGYGSSSGAYQMDVIDAGPPPPTGACCAPDGQCTVTLEPGCTWIWTMFGVCIPNPCPQPRGACCLPSGACLVTEQAVCTGDWTMDGVCVPTPCSQSVPAGGKKELESTKKQAQELEAGLKNQRKYETDKLRQLQLDKLIAAAGIAIESITRVIDGVEKGTTALSDAMEALKGILTVLKEALSELSGFVGTLINDLARTLKEIWKISVDFVKFLEDLFRSEEATADASSPTPLNQPGTSTLCLDTSGYEDRALVSLGPGLGGDIYVPVDSLSITVTSTQVSPDTMYLQIDRFRMVLGDAVVGEPPYEFHTGANILRSSGEYPWFALLDLGNRTAVGCIGGLIENDLFNGDNPAVFSGGLTASFDPSFTHVLFNISAEDMFPCTNPFISGFCPPLSPEYPMWSPPFPGASESITIKSAVDEAREVVQGATLFYRLKGDAAFAAVPMAVVNDTLVASIPPAFATPASVEYYMEYQGSIFAGGRVPAFPEAQFQVPVGERTIQSIQMESDPASPLDGSGVTVVGVVTAAPGDIGDSEFYLSVAPPEPFGGIRVTTWPQVSLGVGDLVRVAGVVREVGGESEVLHTNAGSLTVLQNGLSVSPMQVTPSDVAALEAFEGVLVTLGPAMVVAPLDRETGTLGIALTENAADSCRMSIRAFLAYGFDLPVGLQLGNVTGIVSTVEGKQAITPFRFDHFTATGIDSWNDEARGDRLLRARPNPATSGQKVEIEFLSPGPGVIRIEVYDPSGRKALTLLDGVVQKGWHRVSWDGKDETGKPLPAGVYLCRLCFGNGRTVSGKITLLR